MYVVTFKFAPQQRVSIHPRDLNLIGRVIRCINTGGLQKVYDCDYLSNGEIKRGEFLEDELGEEE